jgi:hypothetical protein
VLGIFWSSNLCHRLSHSEDLHVSCQLFHSGA